VCGGTSRMNAQACRNASVPLRSGSRACLALVALLLVALASAAYALTFPQLTGRVVDEAGILDQAARTALEQKLAQFETRTTGQLVVVTLKSLQGTSIDDYGYQLGRHWGIGQKEKNSGALLIVAPNERKVRIEVGYGLEGQLTDAVSKLIIENSILPRFRGADFAGGISRGVDDIVLALNDPEEWRARARQRPDSQARAVDVIIWALLFIVLLIVISGIARQGSQDPRTMAGRRGRRSGPIFAPVPGPWGSGSSGSSGSGGGFSGGGGSFGGGGASGSW